MRFYIKITLYITAVVALVFAAGSSALISVSFDMSLRRAEAAAVSDTQILLETMQVLDSVERWTDEKSAVNALKKIDGKDSFSSVLFSSKNENLYSKGTVYSDFINLSESIEDGQIVSVRFYDKNNNTYLQTTACFQLGGNPFYLSLAHDLSDIYEAREQQKTIYFRIFAVVPFVCLIVSLIISKKLTRPLLRLSAASKKLAHGDLTYRSKIKSDDEIGALSRDFDAMADRIEKSVSELQLSAKRQAEFMGSFTHELKTPMTSIIGYADLLRGGNLSPDEAASAANYIFNEGKRLENLSLKLLDIFVADKRELKKRMASPKQLVYNIVDYLKPVYDDLRIKFYVVCEDGACLMDTDLVKTMLLNIIDNAKNVMKSGGKIEIRSYMTGKGCRFRITDNGKGMNAETLQHATQAFYREDKSRSSKRGNAGLGLALCEKIAVLHGGDIMFESEEGIGTTVTVTINGGREE